MVGLERGTVDVQPYRPAWRDAYEEEVARLRSLVGDRVVEFAHVGSTAVEGTPAKPVVDILATVADLDEAAGRGEATGLVDRLEDAGYERRPDDVDGRLFFAKGPEEERTHYLHVAEHGSDYARELLAFRDYLRANPDVAAEYGELKRDLAERFPDDRDAYTDEKSAFVERVLADAMSER